MHFGTDVVAVVGSTGTGKSQLAVELARHASRLGVASEAISADSMQTYQGLDVITNKAGEDEMGGVPHHLLSFLPPGDEYDITQFVRDASGLCEQMHERGTLPIIVGGTTYYVQHLLFPGRLVSKADEEAEVRAHAAKYGPVVEARLAALPAELRALWDMLGSDAVRVNAAPDAKPAELWTLLHHVDPESASRWHYRDERKVYRSLRILYDTGIPQSAWLSVQDAHEHEQEHDARDVRARPRRLVFWVWSERDALNARLNARIGKMIERGLLDEICDLRRIAGSAPTDYTRGIFQAIGYKEFDAFLSAGAADTKLFDEAIVQMQTATRRYAKRQTSWIRNQLLPEIHKAQRRGEDVWVYVLDATDLAAWDNEVSEPAKAVLEAFLRHAPMPRAEEVSRAASEQLRAPDTSGGDTIKRNRLVACDVCTSDASQPFLYRESERSKHMQSRTHRMSVKRRTKSAYIAAARAGRPSP